MRAVVFKEHGGPEKLQMAEMPEPKLGPEEVLVRVRACALNHLDLWVRQGLGFPIEMPHIGGSDIAGEIADLGAHVKHLRIGQPVVISPGISCGGCEHCAAGNDSQCAEFDIMGMRRQGGYAEFAKAHFKDIHPVSDRLGFDEWAAVPLAFLTAWHMLVSRARLKPGETVLVHAAGSGIGSAAIQIARLCGARVLATAGSDEKLDLAKRLGADAGINYTREDFAERALKETAGCGVDVVFEHIGPETWPRNLRCMGRGARMVFCGATAGPEATVDIRMAFVKQHSLIGCYMGGKRELIEVLRLVEAGKLRPVLDRRFGMAEVAAAQERMAQRKNFGKIVVRW
ncbi:MAG: zinc-binding dehydrogenase [Verrucomicrobia bacterium]|nr:zinc-binding dehydrogenase [Verrucomicrobiota bacterium]